MKTLIPIIAALITLLLLSCSKSGSDSPVVTPPRDTAVVTPPKDTTVTIPTGGDTTSTHPGNPAAVDTLFHTAVITLNTDTAGTINELDIGSAGYFDHVYDMAAGGLVSAVYIPFDAHDVPDIIIGGNHGDLINSHHAYTGETLALTDSIARLCDKVIVTTKDATGKVISQEGFVIQNVTTDFRGLQWKILDGTDAQRKAVTLQSFQNKLASMKYTKLK